MNQAPGSGRPAGPRGAALRASGKDGPQLIESDGARWTEEAERLFLDQLGASCNVKRSARLAGFSKRAVYARRGRDPAFAEAWRRAIAQGCARIEALLVRNAVRFLEGRAPDPDTPIPVMTVGDAIAILKLHRSSVAGEGRRPGWRPRPRTLDEMRDSILRKLSAIERARRAAEAPPGAPAASTPGGAAPAPDEA